MLFWHGLMGKNPNSKHQFAWEISIFNKIRDFKDGLTVFHIEIESSKDTNFDHNPSWNFDIIFFNYNIIEVNIYNINHAGDE
jgi:hypothetical protein